MSTNGNIDQPDEGFRADNIISRWQNPNRTFTTYHPVIIPPTQPFQTMADAQAWAQATLSYLITPTLELDGRCPLDVPAARDGKSHVVIVQSTEFAFNKYPAGQDIDGNETFAADASHPVTYEYFQEALKILEKGVRGSQFQDHAIVLSLTAVVDYGPIPGLNINLAENASFVVNNQMEGCQKITKFTESNIDNWDTSRYFDWNIDRQEAVDSPERLREHTHTIRDFLGQGKDLAIGVGICLDSALETYPGTHLLMFSGGSMNAAAVKDRTKGGFVWGDTIHFLGGMKNPGERTFKEPVRLGEHRNGEEAALFAEYARHLAAAGLPQDQIDNLRTVSPSDVDAFMWQERIGMTWPLTIREGQAYYRRMDYNRVGDSEIVMGKPRPLPKEPMAADGRIPLNMVQMNEFETAEEFIEVWDDALIAADKRGLEISYDQLWELHNFAVEDAVAEGRSVGGLHWAQRVQEAMQVSGEPDGFPMDGAAGGGSADNGHNHSLTPEDLARERQREIERQREEARRAGERRLDRERREAEHHGR